MQRVETLDRSNDVELPRRQQTPLAVSAPFLSQSLLLRTVLGGLTTSVTSAIAGRRIFVLLPFAMIFGLVGYVQLPFEPEPLALLGMAIVLLSSVIVSWRSPMLPVLTLFFGFWAGLCLLPIHGIWFGTPMLSFPAYGAFEARVDEIISATAEDRRIIVSNLTPTAGDRAVPIL